MIPLPSFEDRDDLRDVCTANLKQLGVGAYRQVFSLGDGTVLKISAYHDGNESNLQELAVWNAVQDTPISEWLSPVISCAESGDWLIMREAVGGVVRGRQSDQTVRVRSSIERPHKLPGGKRLWGSDLHGGNMAFTETGAVVVIDYGSFTIEEAE